jgi:hypothetical protein
MKDRQTVVKARKDQGGRLFWAYRRKQPNSDPASSGNLIDGPVNSGMSIKRRFLVAAKSRAESLPWIGSSAKSWAMSPTSPLAVSFGSWTTAPLIAARELPIVCAINGPMPSSSTLQPMPIGSIKSKSISPSCRGKSSRPTISLLWPNSNSVSLPFRGHYERTASPFKWTFTRNDLHTLLAKIAAKQLAPAA